MELPQWWTVNQDVLHYLNSFSVAQYLNITALFIMKLCIGKTWNLGNIIDVFVRCVNKTRCGSLKVREFRQFLTDVNEKYGEVLLRCAVRWLSKGKGTDKLFTNFCDEVYAFKMKLRLFIRQLTKGILDAFPTLMARLLE
ncbi:hypothetical protein RF11_10315 [Thelohanellus kitauei]|uniref:Uncharacterized protein n=1 Tax=Thelohanellus kitauei TaxID=669202 RepID=A0A0C2MN48_THEKT|nr:hypothetical protein RF11_10315 [Thelohanellus kitauei]